MGCSFPRRAVPTVQLHVRPLDLISDHRRVGEEQSYQEWLKRKSRAVEGLAGKQGASLKEILPKVRPNYRPLIITWASDPRTFGAVADLLRTALAFGVWAEGGDGPRTVL